MRKRHKDRQVYPHHLRPATRSAKHRTNEPLQESFKEPLRNRISTQTVVPKASIIEPGTNLTNLTIPSPKAYRRGKKDPRKTNQKLEGARG